MEKYLVSKEDMKTVGKKLVFKNKLYEGVDDPLLALINKVVLNKIAEKIPDNVLVIVQEALKSAIEEMPEIEI
jgi:hypothetical protein